MNSLRLNATTAFIIGSPRSGTTWLQLMLSEHPSIASPQEMDLFSRYLPKLWHEWETEMHDAINNKAIPWGLISCLTQEEFVELLRLIVTTSYTKILNDRPWGTVVLEKNPAYSLHIPLINQVLPEARFIHLIRDGRDVALSLLAASQTWGRSWAPTKFAGAARHWKQHVTAAQQAQIYTERYIEVRYEELHSNGITELIRIFEFLGYQVDEKWCNEVYQRNKFDKANMQSNSHRNIFWEGEAARLQGVNLKFATDFFRQGKSGSWHKSMTTNDRWWFDHIAGDLLIELGYAQPGWASTGLIKDVLLTFIAENQKRLNVFRQRLAWKLWHDER